MQQTCESGTALKLCIRLFFLEMVTYDMVRRKVQYKIRTASLADDRHQRQAVTNVRIPKMRRIGLLSRNPALSTRGFQCQVLKTDSFY